MPRIYYCENCHQFVDREGFYDVFKTPKELRGICSVCKNKTLVFEVEHSNWVKIGKPFGIIFGLFFGIIIFYLLHIGHQESGTIYDYIWYFLFVFVVTIIIIIGMVLGLSLFDPDTVARKVVKEHPELEEKKLKAQYEKLPDHCNRCNKKLPKGVNKCPYCGQDQY